ncbi:MAG: hypothetical protein JWP09_435 [Candidatus Taylorbacteria bacterium]|nr:hypothetical protein [Candidatus Taylorbacteria bacterium]
MNNLLNKTIRSKKDFTEIRETVLARYIIEINSWSKDKLINSLMDLKILELKNTDDRELIKYLYASRRRK